MGETSWLTFGLRRPFYDVLGWFPVFMLIFLKVVSWGLMWPNTFWGWLSVSFIEALGPPLSSIRGF